jgi:hypothetical protein
MIPSGCAGSRVPLPAVKYFQFLGAPAMLASCRPCVDSQVLRAICDRLDPRDFEVFFAWWTTAVATLFTDADNAGYVVELSMRQFEVSRALVFDNLAEPEGSSSRSSPTTSVSVAHRHIKQI